jgi:CheY-like chemotaxis protein
MEVRRLNVPVRADAANSVILVDDDLATREMYQTGLLLLGFEVTVVGDATEMFRAIDVHVPDIVVLDWELQGARGDEVLHQIRLDQRTRRLPVFMLSNFPATAVGAIDKVFQLGALAWFEKVKTPPGLLAEKLTEALVSRSELAQSEGLA